MIAACEICGELLTGRPTGPALVPTTDEQRAAVDLQEFDLLASAVANHMSLRHEPHGMNMMACANLAAKVYAMTQARSSDERFETLRDSWKAGILKALFETTYAADGSTPATPAPSSTSVATS
jgi:hypothetical protein